MINIFPIIRGKSGIPSEINRRFENLITLINNTIVNVQPNFYYGANPKQLDPRIRK
jgi:hypothetical protein